MRKPTKQPKKSSKVASRAPKVLKPVSAARTVAPAPTQIEFTAPFPVIHKPDATADTTAMAPDEPQKAANF